VNTPANGTFRVTEKPNAYNAVIKAINRKMLLHENETDIHPDISFNIKLQRST
jgi:hypothetical protein